MSFHDYLAKDVTIGFKMCSFLLGEEIIRYSELKYEVKELI